MKKEEMATQSETILAIICVILTISIFILVAQVHYYKTDAENNQKFNDIYRTMNDASITALNASVLQTNRCLNIIDEIDDKFPIYNQPYDCYINEELMNCNLTTTEWFNSEDGSPAGWTYMIDTWRME